MKKNPIKIQGQYFDLYSPINQGQWANLRTYLDKKNETATEWFWGVCILPAVKAYPGNNSDREVVIPLDDRNAGHPLEYTEKLKEWESGLSELRAKYLDYNIVDDNVIEFSLGVDGLHKRIFGEPGKENPAEPIPSLDIPFTHEEFIKFWQDARWEAPRRKRPIRDGEILGPEESTSDRTFGRPAYHEFDGDLKLGAVNPEEWYCAADDNGEKHYWIKGSPIPWEVGAGKNNIKTRKS